MSAPKDWAVASQLPCALGSLHAAHRQHAPCEHIGLLLCCAGCVVGVLGLQIVGCWGTYVGLCGLEVTGRQGTCPCICRDHSSLALTLSVLVAVGFPVLCVGAGHSVCTCVASTILSIRG